MNTTRITASRFAVIVTTAAVVVAGLVAAFAFSGWSGSDSPARDAADREAQDTAGIYCNLEDILPGMTGLDDSAHLECVKQRPTEDMPTWDARQ